MEGTIYQKNLSPESSDTAIPADAKSSYTATASTFRPQIPGKEVQVAGYRFYSPEVGRWLNRDPIGEEGGTLLYGFAESSPVCFVDPLGNLAAGTIALIAGTAYLVGNVAITVYDSIVLPLHEWSRNEEYCSTIICWARERGVDLLDISMRLSPAYRVVFCSYWRECQPKNRKVTLAATISVGATSLPGVTPGGGPVTSEADVIAALITQAASRAGATEDDVVQTGKIVVSGDAASMAVTVRTNDGLMGMCSE